MFSEIDLFAKKENELNLFHLFAKYTTKQNFTEEDEEGELALQCHRRQHHFFDSFKSKHRF